MTTGLSFFGKANVSNEVLSIRLSPYRGTTPGVETTGHGEWAPAFKSHSVSKGGLAPDLVSPPIQPLSLDSLCSPESACPANTAKLKSLFSAGIFRFMLNLSLGLPAGSFMSERAGGLQSPSKASPARGPLLWEEG